MELSDFRIFLAIVESGSISGAADQLHTVQSNVSARLRSLEKRTGSPLFHRHARGITLTPSGEIFLPYARRITQLMSESFRVMTDVEDPTGSLSIGSMETTAGWRLPTLLAQFVEDCPKVDVTLRTGTTDELLREVVEHRLDGAFVAGSISASELEYRPVFEEELVLVSSRRREPVAIRSSPSAVPTITEGDDNGMQPPRLLVFREGCNYRKQLQHLVTKPGGPPPPVVVFGSLEGILGCVAAGMGVTLLPMNVVRSSALVENLRLQSLPAEQGRTITYFVRHKESPLMPAMRRFLDVLRAANGSGSRDGERGVLDAVVDAS